MVERQTASGLARATAVLGGVAFFLSLIYFLHAYLGRFGRVTAPDATSTAWAVGVNVALFAVFALHHSAFARLGLKRRITDLVSPAFERSVYVWASSALFFVVCALWRPVPGVAWSITPPVSLGFLATEMLGAILAVYAATRLDVLDLAGVRQALAVGPAPAGTVLRQGPYGWVRHPVYLGWVLLVWATPVMTGTRLVFAAASTIYVVAAIPLEERDLARAFGPAYADYRRVVRWRLVPFLF